MVRNKKLKTHPKLLAAGYNTIPTIIHKGVVINGFKGCLQYITENFGLEICLIPEAKKEII